jgi:hypothetical protein
MGECEVERAEVMVDIEADWRRTRRYRSNGLGRYDRGSGYAPQRQTTQDDDNDGHAEGQRRRSDGGRQPGPAELVIGVDGQGEGVIGENDHGAVLAEGT